MATKDKLINLEDLKVLSDHVEGEVTDLKSDFSANIFGTGYGEYNSAILQPSFLSWEVGTIYPSGSEDAAKNRFRSVRPIYLDSGTSIVTIGDYKVSVLGRDTNGNIIYNSNDTGPVKSIVLPCKMSVRFVIARDDNANISSTDISNINNILRITTELNVFDTQIDSSLFSLGSRIPTNGAVMDSTTRIRSDLFASKAGNIVWMDIGDNNQYIVYEYDEFKNFISATSWTHTKRYTIENDGYISILLSKTNSATITTDMIDGMVSAIHIRKAIESLQSDGVVSSDDNVTPLALKNGFTETFTGFDVEHGSWDGGGGAQSGYSYRVRSTDWFSIPYTVIVKNINPSLKMNVVSAIFVDGTKTSVTAWGWVSGAFEYYIPYSEERVYKIIVGNIDDSTTLSFDDFLDSILIMPEQNSISVDKYNLLPNWLSSVNDVQALQGTRFTIGVQTDTHQTADAPNIFCTPLKNLTKYIGFDYICNLGDITKGYASDTKTEMQTALTNLINRYTDGVECPFLYALGNHEDDVLYAIANGNDLSDVILADEIYAKTIAKVKNTCNINQPNKGFYYYVDFDDVRVIVLNTRDIAWQEISSSDIGISHHTISQTQISWLTQTALNTDKAVIVMSHVPLLDSQTTETCQNSGLVRSALETFVANGGTVVACLAGHTHSAAVSTSNGINYIVFDDGGQFAEVVMVDLANRTIDFKYVGFIGTRVDRTRLTF